jgi:hypothetical protein
LAPTQRVVLPTAPPATPASPARPVAASSTPQPTPQPTQPAAPPPTPPAAPQAAPQAIPPAPATAGIGAAGPPTTPLLGLDVIYDDLADDGSGVPHESAPDEQTRSQTRTVLLLVAGFVVVFLALAYCGLRGLGQSAFVPAPRTKSATPSPSTSAPATTTQAPTSSSSAAGPLRVASASGFDPEGDGEEKNDLAARAIDGNASTVWTSDTYKSAQFGGLKKGVGLLLDLGGRQQVTSVTVRVGAGGGTFQLRTADGGQLGSTALAQVTDAAGTITLTPSAPVTTGQLVLWCTQAAQVDGGYRVEVAEVVVK